MPTSCSFAMRRKIVIRKREVMSLKKMTKVARISITYKLSNTLLQKYKQVKAKEIYNALSSNLTLVHVDKARITIR